MYLLRITKVLDRQSLAFQIRKEFGGSLKEVWDISNPDSMPWERECWKTYHSDWTKSLDGVCEYTITEIQLAVDERWLSEYERSPLKEQVTEAQVWYETLSRVDQAKVDLLGRARNQNPHC